MRMIKFAISMFLALSASIGTAAASSPVGSPNPIDFTGLEIGQSHPFAKVHAHVEGLNVSGNTLEIERVVASDSKNASFKFEPVKVKASESFALDMEITLNADVGRVSHHFDVYAKGQANPIDGFSVQGFSDWLVSPEGTDIEFGIFEAAKPIRRIVPIEVRPGVSVKLVGIEKPSAYFDAKVVQGGKALELSSKEDAPWSSFDEKILVKTDNDLQPLVAFRLRGQVRGSVVPSSDPLDFGLVREGDGAELTLVLNDVSGKPLKIGAVVSNSRMKVSTKVVECFPSNPSCRNLKVIYPPMNLRGVTGGMLEIELPDYKRKLFVRFGALGIGKDTQVKDLAEELKKASEVEPSVSSVLRQAMQQPTNPVEMPAPDGNGPLLTWKSTHENGVYGYEIYRSNLQDGPFQRVSAGIISRLDQTGKQGSIYRWRDADYKSGMTYWYYVNLVMENGTKRKFTSAQKVVAK
ncbi:MAG TPA: hypothetical protein VFN25_11165 [Dokdonella sp.]|uniref:hypothetical protein n=1 Tax=Dokdonella sp. TaxID=2291710 RepID=UPI002D801ABC|nr:hypothetical protein [Dokdonella sp.]HET9033452.1 hypothetical protein [Dokdonella sp.]